MRLLRDRAASLAASGRRRRALLRYTRRLIAHLVRLRRLLDWRGPVLAGSREGPELLLHHEPHRPERELRRRLVSGDPRRAHAAHGDQCRCAN
uniref:Uncharacterized protein n=1 Tax=Arundo donax TaxID=35708 RepID=A0A0A9EL50_ARUDO